MPKDDINYTNDIDDIVDIVSNYRSFEDTSAETDEGAFYSPSAPGRNKVEYDDNDEPLTDNRNYKPKNNSKNSKTPRNFNNLDKINRSAGVNMTKAKNGANMASRNIGNNNNRVNTRTPKTSSAKGVRDPYSMDFDSEPKTYQAPPRRQKPQKSQYTIFYTLTIATGVVICIILMIVMFDMFNGTSTIIPGETTQATPVSTPVPTVEPIPTNEAIGMTEIEVEMTGFINSVDSANSTVRIVDTATSDVINLTSTRTTTLRNKYGEALVFGQLKAGDIVNVVYYRESRELLSLNLNSLAWEFENVSDIKIDNTGSVVTMGNQSYTVHNDAIITKKGQPYSIGQISGLDKVTIRGIQNSLYYLNVTESHGYITFTGGEAIKNGSIEIDTSMFLQLAHTSIVDITEGTHRIVVKGDNINPFIKEIDVVSGETAEINLSQLVVVKDGSLVIECNQNDYTAYVNNELVNPNEPITISYGSHKLRVEKDGYEAFETDFTVSSDLTVVSATLSQKIEMSKVSIVTTPESCDIYIDSNFVGTSELEIPVEYGEHTITVSKTGYLTQSFDVELLAKERGFWFVLSEDPNYTTDPQLPSYTPDPDTQSQVTMPQASSTPEPEPTPNNVIGLPSATPSDSYNTDTHTNTDTNSQVDSNTQDDVINTQNENVNQPNTQEEIDYSIPTI